MRLHLYLAKIFLSRFLLWLLGLITAVFIFEASVGHTFFKVNLSKIALAVHVAFPFLVFLSTQGFIQRLCHFSEGQALQSCGLSVFGIMRAPLMVTGVLAILELMYVVPLTHGVSSKFDFLKAPKSWSLSIEEEGFTIFRSKQTQCALWIFNVQGCLKKNVIGDNPLRDKDGLKYQKGWRWSPCHAPEILSQKNPEIIPLVKEVTIQHPWLMPFSDILRAIRKRWITTNIFRFQRDYWLSKLAWSVSLVVFGFGLFMGSMSTRRRTTLGIFGLVLCLVFYMVQEILYLMNWPYSYLGKTFILWIVPLLTALGGWILLFEKREL